ERLADLRIIDDALLRNAQSGHAANMRLDLEHLITRQPAQPFQTIRGSPFLEIAQAGKFALIGCYDELAADLMRDRVFPAKLHHLANAGDGQPRLYRARLVVKSAMQHAAVVARLVPPYGALF